MVMATATLPPSVTPMISCSQAVESRLEHAVCKYSNRYD